MKLEPTGSAIGMGVKSDRKRKSKMTPKSFDPGSARTKMSLSR